MEKSLLPGHIHSNFLAQVISYRRLANTSTNDKVAVKINWPDFDRPVLEEMCIETGDPKALITIIATKGSVPRKAGAKMLVWPYGKIIGSIGGGCSEGEVINISRQMIGTGRSKIHDIDMTGQIAEDEGMVCGGIMRALIEDCNGRISPL